MKDSGQPMDKKQMLETAKKNQMGNKKVTDKSVL